MVLAILCGGAAGLCFAAFVVVVITAIAFSGSTGSAWQGFLPRLSPLARFAAGAFLAAGTGGVINAIADAHEWATRTIFNAALLGGLAAMRIPPIGDLALSAAAAAFHLFGQLYAGR